MKYVKHIRVKKCKQIVLEKRESHLRGEYKSPKSVWSAVSSFNPGERTDTSFCGFNKWDGKVPSHVTTDGQPPSQSVCLGVETFPVLTTRCLLLLDG